MQFHRATILPKEGSVKFLINIFEGSGEFELCEGGSVAVSGKISVPENVNKELLNLPKPQTKTEPDVLPLNSADIYKELRLRGYDYEGIFRGVAESDNRGINGKLKWENNWISFIDTMLQFSILGQNTRELYLPTRLQRIVINPKLHAEHISSLPEGDNVPVTSYRNISVIKSGGVEIRGMKASLAPRRQQAQAPPKLEKYQFIPYDNQNPLSEDTEKARQQVLTALLQLVLENSSGALKLKASEVVVDRPIESALGPQIVEILEREPMVAVDYTVVNSGAVDASSLDASGIKSVIRDVTSNPVDQNVHLVVIVDAFAHERSDIIQNSVAALKTGGFILAEEPKGPVDFESIDAAGLVVVSTAVTSTKTYALLRKPTEVPTDATVINITEKNFAWVEPLKDALKQSESDGSRLIYLVTQGEELTGLVGLVNCITKEPGGNSVRAFFLQDAKAEKFSLTSRKYAEQLKKDLVHNVLKNNVWGSFRHILLEQLNDSGKLQVEHAYINTLVRGDLSSLKWIEGPLTYYKGDDPNSELCSVYYAPLNFRDIMLATGKLPPDALPGDLAGQDCILGLEFSGRDTKGRRVMGMVAARSLATTVLADPGFLWEVPEKWSLEQASTIPVVYGTVSRNNLLPHTKCNFMFRFSELLRFDCSRSIATRRIRFGPRWYWWCGPSIHRYSPTHGMHRLHNGG